MIETGSFTPWDTRAFVSASKASNDNPFNNYGKVNKQQYNAKIYQPIGNGGDFVALAGHYNQNRNNFFGSVAAAPGPDPGRRRRVGAAHRRRPGQQPLSAQQRRARISRQLSLPRRHAPGRRRRCAGAVVRSAPRPDLLARPAGNFASCGTEFDRRYNPSNTGNIRLASRFTFGAFTLTVDPSYQYVKANGGGTVTGHEGLRDINPADPPAPDGAVATPAAVPRRRRTTPSAPASPAISAASPFFGRDINGDGDALDAVTVLAPSQTQTHRFGLIAGVRYDINDDHAVRAGYTFDRARHRQTGEVGLLDIERRAVRRLPGQRSARRT